MTPLGIVITNYNRLNNLRFTLRALKEQTCQAFHVIVADDGSTDGSVQEVERLMSAEDWQGRLQFVSGGPHQGARIAHLRNLALANLPSVCSFALILDGDICLMPDALEQIASLHTQFPEAVTISRLDWLPPLEHDTISQFWDQGGIPALLAQVPDYPMRLYRQTPTGAEFRELSFTPAPVPLNYQLFHPVYGIPTALFWRTGGFDEQMRDYGLHEHEYALRMAAAGASMLVRPEIRAVHIWHPKDAKIEAKVHWQRQRNIAYLLRKHGAQAYINLGRDWRYWRHYRVSGSRVVASSEGSNRVLCVVNAENSHRLTLPDEHWLFVLGFSNHDVEAVDPKRLNQWQDAGIAQDYLDEIEFPSHLPVVEPASQPVPAISMQQEIQNFRLQELLYQFDRERTRFDHSRWSHIPLIGTIYRHIGRMLWSGHVWARESALLQEINERITALPGNPNISA
ncbi:MAG: glycosyl transferase family 2 protein [Chloroflexi bacterium OLB15]|nr:MAG: glycosyl transferase family 2 protein [Chloroflexi bacterium OLB15]